MEILQCIQAWLCFGSRVASEGILKILSFGAVSHCFVNWSHIPDDVY